MDITEKALVAMCGWPVFQKAKALHAAGRVSEALYENGLLKGRVSDGEKSFLAGLRIKNPIDVDNLCPCRDSRVRAIICEHSVAVGLAFLHPKPDNRPEHPEPAATPRSEAGTATSEVPAVEISIEGSLRHIDATLSFRYSSPGLTNPAAERLVLEELLAAGFEPSGQGAVLRGEAAIVRFFAGPLPSWKKRWTVREGERFRHVSSSLVPIEPQFRIRETSEGWLDFHVHFSAGRQAVLSHPDLIRLLRGGESAVKLADGRSAVPDPAMLADLEEVLRDCDPVQDGGGYRIRDVHRDYLKASLAQWTDAVPASDDPDEPVPGSLAKLLRPYQVDGARWLLKLARRNAGGILADEMGLGKTLQALAMIEVLPGPHLVVCPSSLVWNWAREAGRFVPALRTLPIHGPSRAKLFASIASSDLVITSYPLLQRDIDHYRAVNFTTLILDEAQHIKNPDSRNAKSAALLRSPARFVLTGTPLENSIRDLWSLFDFILPGYLGARADFRDRYEKPLLDGERGLVWSRLLRRVRPWILRRKKSDVLTDLPDKIEQIIEVDLTASQKEAYTNLQIAARAELDQLRERGSTGRMQVLTALLRLRQACCDLRLLDVESSEPSAKLDALLELISEAADGGHRVLVFSQFTSMLDLIATALDSAGIAFCRLDGGTKDRGSVVERFQSDPGLTVFLISLKAGGTGLNITAAGTVIHFDPWWNPAAENQATDRAHRIGQKQVVTAIKLVARDTVENRVIELQQRKKLLLDGVLDAGAFDQSLDDDDLAALIG